MELPDLKTLAAVGSPVIGAILWVGRLQQRVTAIEKDNSDFKTGLAKHITDDGVAHQRIAKIEGQNEQIAASLKRIEDHLLARK